MSHPTVSITPDPLLHGHSDGSGHDPRCRECFLKLLVLARQSGLLPGEQRALNDQHEQIGDGGDSCGGWTTSGGPCGGCTTCLHAQVSFYAYVEAKRRQCRAMMGLLVWPRRLLPDWQPFMYPSCPTWWPRVKVDA